MLYKISLNDQVLMMIFKNSNKLSNNYMFFFIVFVGRVKNKSKINIYCLRNYSLNKKL
jgi:hypothetical protein